MTDALLDLQALDTEARQLHHRRSHLDELVVAKAARDRVDDWERRRAVVTARLAELDEAIRRSEADAAAIDTHRTRLAAQLRTVISPREAEALQAELATLAARRSDLDDAGLAALDEQVEAEGALEALAAEEPTVRAELAVAAEAVAAAVAEIDARLAELAAARDERRAGIGSDILARYDRLVEHHGVAISRLVGTHCEGCHLDLSAAELDQVRASAVGGVADCPQCGRMLAL
jgi:predicted  nucleic acid-binding Zn-ribbon protein